MLSAAYCRTIFVAINNAPESPRKFNNTPEPENPKWEDMDFVLLVSDDEKAGFGQKVLMYHDVHKTLYAFTVPKWYALP